MFRLIDERSGFFDDVVVEERVACCFGGDDKSLGDFV